jgi:acetyltransferase-like isoleucine patch superfamily enzyme
MLKKIIIKLGYLRYRLLVHSRYKRKFKSIGNSSLIRKALKIDGYENIEIGERVIIGYNSWLASVALTGHATSVLSIGDGCSIGNFNHIYATRKIVIGKKVLTADKVYISDNLHGYENIHLAILDQPIRQIGDVTIGDGAWLGENVCVLGVSIGKNCVVGANAVVTKDIPDYCIAVGNPAKIIKRYCLETKAWKKTSADGKFID